jgi:hypothetical protein
MGMTTREMARALTVYIQTFKLFCVDILYETADGVLKGLVELPVEQLAADEFAVRLEFYGSDSKGGSAGASVIRLIDGTGCIVQEMHPTDGHYMLLKLKELILPRGAKALSDEAGQINVLCLLTRLLDRLVR